MRFPSELFSIKKAIPVVKALGIALFAVGGAGFVTPKATAADGLFSGAPRPAGSKVSSRFSCEVIFTAPQMTEPTASPNRAGDLSDATSDATPDATSNATSDEATFSSEPLRALYTEYFSKSLSRELSFESLMQRLANSPAHQRLWAEWIEARRSLARVREASLSIKDPYTRKMFQAAESAVQKHFPLFFSRLDQIEQSENGQANEASRQDQARFFQILKAVQKIDEQFLKPDLFRLQRLITQRYDLDQFIECRD
jgi:hypothetical protein